MHNTYVETLLLDKSLCVDACEGPLYSQVLRHGVL